MSKVLAELRDQRIERYARLAVCKGVGLQKGQELVVNAPVERADFVRRVVRVAYEEGARHVTVIWGDDVLTRLDYDNVDIERLTNIPAWKRDQLNSLADDGAAFLLVHGADPKALTGVDPTKISAVSRAFSEQVDRYRAALDFGKNAWSIVGVPIRAWAATVFPGVDDEEAQNRLWDAILHTARADGEDPLHAWDIHNQTFAQHKEALNTYAFESLHYRSSNGTDLTIGLNEGHIWEGGSSKTTGGTTFFPNIPTEEVFTSPDRMRAEGIVYSALPLVHAGNLVTDFWLRFEEGRVVEFDAAEGRDVLASIVETDEHSCRLGECALIAKDTPIRESGLLFYDTLYDENASCHLALGKGFPECIEGGMEMSRDELMARGLNQSNTHVDFMIGSDDIDIRGITKDGEEVAIFTDGTWAEGFR